ncbi:MAG: ribulose-phosphate 3-epimerase [Fimbriimonadaceae bacterium]|nr:ribulose-phosphate 3-epimerase [Fimbriimonadaceae bacterium]QYK55850.1 MAG: ribulose-phosphate 3-epimerase [Fimbriimonadaceae bacterium]
MTVRIAPSILSCDPADFASPVRDLAAAGADVLHLDVMDGQFVPPITFGADLAVSLAKVVSIPIEAHLMVQAPERHVGAFLKAGCFRVIFHAEATVHAHRLAQEIREAGAEAGVAINPGTPVEALYPLLDVVDLALVMTVNPGYGGQRLIPGCLEKVRALHSLRPDLGIEVDGGIDPETAPKAAQAGATWLVAGSFLVSGADIAGNMRRLRESCA